MSLLELRKLRHLRENIILNYQKIINNFILKYNGGKPVIRRFSTLDDKQTSLLMLLFPLSESNEPNLEGNYMEFNESKIIPSNLLSIGDDPIENKICISVSGDDKGYIYYWSLDMEDIDEEDYLPSYKNMSLIAKSFTEFMNGLCVTEES
ncbi:SMI1/KNR4 family protein [Paenibacillus woosongensis]|uniref:SMI1/KNR4 family protein n=1 Tax=Paenibacillus woosongensis TaxID=307580 RepID=A0AA95KS94_9BACL|nr:SMI1/KNR4 family protein [Paenibacillus woosongensis]WHX47198.1 SMI1/KNR4 family protein [Paenibacillus woosongensis]